MVHLHSLNSISNPECLLDVLNWTNERKECENIEWGMKELKWGTYMKDAKLNQQVKQIISYKIVHN